MMPIKPEQAIRQLKRKGCIEAGGKGGHRKIYNPATNKTSIVPMHKGKDIKDHEWRNIQRQLGLED